MTHKLFEVSITYTAIVVADDWDDAYFKTRDVLEDIIRNEESEIEVREEIRDNVPSDWVGVIPYGGDGTMTCEQILEMTDEQKKKSVIDNLSDEEKKLILSQMNLSDIESILNKSHD